MTVKTLAPVPVPESGLVTVTLRGPAVALPARLTLSVSSVDESTVVELTVIPVPEKDAEAPLRKCEPVTVTVWLLAP